MFATNPFPGMNPFLEQRWQDFHSGYIAAMGNAINDRLPNDLVARTETDLYVTSREGERPITPDAYVVELPEKPGTPGGHGVAVVAAPVRVRMRREPVRVHRIEIREPATDNRIITAIELFSPTNKKDSKGRKQYELKRREYREAGVNLVEIDLIRGGRHLIAAPPGLIPKEVQKLYKICVVRAESRDGSDEFELYGAALDEALPPIAIPLRPDDVDINLELQLLLDECMRRRRYFDLRYDEDLDPAATEEERAFIQSRVEAARVAITAAGQSKPEHG